MKIKVVMCIGTGHVKTYHSGYTESFTGLGLTLKQQNPNCSNYTLQMYWLYVPFNNSSTDIQNWYLAFPKLWEEPCHWYSPIDVYEAQLVALGIQDEISLRGLKKWCKYDISICFKVPQTQEAQQQKQEVHKEPVAYLTTERCLYLDQ